MSFGKRRYKCFSSIFLLKKSEGSIYGDAVAKYKSELKAQRSAVEGVIIVNGRPRIERADMPLTFSFDTIENLERFCKVEKHRQQGQH